MERLNSQLKNSGQTFETARELRIPNRLTVNPNAFSIFPPTIGTSKKNATNGTRSGSQSSQTRPKFKPALTEHSAKSSTGIRPNASKPKPQSSDESSGDELDLLSESSHQDSCDDPSSSQKLVSFLNKPKSQVMKSADPYSNSFGERPNSKEDSVYVDRSGKRHEFHPNFKPAERKYANLSFKKKNTTSSAEIPAAKPEQSLFSPRKVEPVSKENTFFQNNGPSSWSPIRSDASSSNTGKGKDKTIDLTPSPTRDWDDNEVAPASPLSGKSANSNRTITPPPLRSSQPLLGRKPTNSSGTPAVEETRNGPAKERPKPRPVQRGPPKATEEGGLAGPRSEEITFMLGTRSRLRPRPDSPKLSSPKRKEKAVSKAASPLFTPPHKPAPFPVALDSGNFPEQPKTTDARKKPPVSSSRRPKAFPLFEDSDSLGRTSQAKTHIRTVKDKIQPKGKGKGKEKVIFSEDEDEDEDEEMKHCGLKPKAFPMSKQLMSSTGSSGSSRPGKRNSDYGSDEERVSKKSRMKMDNILRSLSPFDDEGESMSLAPHADPKTLCPFCDTSLPPHPTPLLLKLLEATKKKARPDPRPSNPLGLRAPLTTYISTCQRHRFESKILPEAERKGWPKTINWKKVSGRVLKMKDLLQALIEDSGDNMEPEPILPGESEWEVMYGNISKTVKVKKIAKGPKASSIFWMELMEEIEKKGLRSVSGVRGQFASFEKAQPGYYGELGSVIIYQTLYNMFPPTEIDPDLTSPLTPTEFVQRILVPEVALHLIMEDQSLEGEDGMKDALEILRDSSSYGVAMFPEDGGELGENKRRGKEDKMGEGDLIVMERARKRRKELKEEEEREEEERRFQDEEDRKLEEVNKRLEAEKAKKIQKRRKGRQPSVADSIEVSEPVAVVERPRPRPIPVTKSKTDSLFSGPETDEDKLATTRRWTRSRSRSIVSDESDCEKDNARRPSSEERRRSPSASESKEPIPVRRTVPSRAPSHDMARLNIGYNDSDSSTHAMVNGEGRTGSRTRSTSVHHKEKETSRANMKVISSDDDSEVQFVDDMKTPLPKRERPPYAVNDDDTPKPGPARNLDPAEKELPPLLMARHRSKLKTTKPNPSRKPGTDFPSKDTYDWVFTESSSQ